MSKGKKRYQPTDPEGMADIMEHPEWVRLKNAYSRLKSIVAEIEEMDERKRELRLERRRIGDIIVESKKELRLKTGIGNNPFNKMINEAFGAPHFKTVSVTTTKK